MNNILFFDLEIDEKTEKIQDIGAILNGETFHSSSVKIFEYFAKDATFICGHNIINHDLKFLHKVQFNHDFLNKDVIDTLYLSALLFSEKPYHNLVKDYRLNSSTVNNPLSDSKLVESLFYDLVNKFKELSSSIATIYYSLLKNITGFKGFFNLPDIANICPLLTHDYLIRLIKQEFNYKICQNIDLESIIIENPVELSYSLSLISTQDTESIIPPWILHERPSVIEILRKLRLKNCHNEACNYCNDRLNPQKALYDFFGYKNFRRFDYDGEMPLQEHAVRAALEDKSLLAIFPTGGGKSLAFQLPALMAGEANRSLTVVISPLQSLMKDQVDVLKKRFDITRAVTINGLLSPLERSEAIERVLEGGANLLYISPESLRSGTILSLMKNRQIARFVIDEAHCFSSWGQDFRVDYLYIGNFLKLLMEEKKLPEPIPVSCFTATAKISVIEDITNYFKEKLNIHLEIFQTHARRENLTFNVFEAGEEPVKYEKLKNLLMEKEGPKIIYVSRVKTTEALSEKLQRDGFNAKPYNGQMDSEQKIVTQNDFMEGNIDVIVATSAFGMGVDKDNVSMVIHYEISDSLENYVQEAGRAGRKEDLEASCYILFDEKDLNKHFTLLNNTKLNHKEIAQIWRGIKNFKREKFTKSALEIAKSAGWDAEMKDLDTRVKTAISTLEDSGYVERGQNAPRIFADSFLIRDVSEANKQIDITDKLNDQEKISAKRIFQHLVSHNDTKVDYMAEILGIAIEEVSKILNILKEIKVIGDTKDLTAFIDISRTRKNSKKLFILYKEVEQKLIELLTYPEDNKTKRIHLKEINEKLIESAIQKSSIEILRNILRYWSHKDLITRKRIDANNHTYDIHFKYDYITFKGFFETRIEVAEKVLDYLHSLHKKQIPEGNQEAESVLIEFSLMEIKTAVENSLFSTSNSLLFYEGILLYLHETGSVKLESGLLICYNSFTITRLEQSNQKQFTKENYKKLESFYENKIEQIHIVGEYARKILESYEEAMIFVDNYFRMEYKKFINRYFPERKTEIKRPLTEKKFKEIFGTLSTQQLNIIKDNMNKHILVLAGPGSGKTRILVHKIASLLLLEDIKPEQFLMLTFSRSAAMEFKNRLVKLVGNVGYYIDIFTYHSFAFNLLGRLGSLEKSDKVIQQATCAIIHGELSDLRIDNKSVLVVDEYQDIGQEEFDLLNVIIKQAEDIRVIVVGDDDQNIYEFKGSSSRYMKEFKEKYDSENYYLDTNYRSKANIVDFSNLYLRCLSERMKKGCTLRSNTKDNGSVKIIKYTSEHLIIPLVEHIISSKLPGTTAVLTNTNEEAMLIETVLKQRGVPAKLILANEGFPLKNLVELRTFTHYISKEIIDELGLITEDLWTKAKEKIKKDYDRSIKLDLVFDIIHRFEKANPRKFKSEWKSYLEEIRIEEFYFPDKDIILVSTMHKAKGKEFDNVFLLLNNYMLSSDEKKRVLYVAITRTKKNLFIHTNQDYFDKLTVKNFVVRYDSKHYDKPDCLVIQLTLKDINLNFQKNQINGIRKIQAGDVLYVNEFNLLQDSNKMVSIKYSKDFEQRNTQIVEKGYQMVKAEIGYVVVWNYKEDNKDYRILLPKILYKSM